MTRTTIDAQGRVLIPAEIRRRLHLDPNSEVELVVLGNELVLRKKNRELEKRAAVWKARIMSTRIEAGTESSADEKEIISKWVDEDHVKKKLGLG